jgi:hypothetical protein
LAQANDEAAAKHLAECATCRAEASALNAAVGLAKARRRQTADLPDARWRKQREAINARLPAGESALPWKRWAWVGATAMLILLASTLLSRNTPPRSPAVAPADPDDALLHSVQQSIRSELPRALKPASLLTKEIDGAEAANRIH